ncbi:hypothetical protein M569_16622 [Genlisea aurea]|uniref:Uncharacterized protein n=1 Tax=Genlisea aurea TaxID=192259 RepID=S8BUZ7_9LAMI|nr:hypothetical protein M569_16622 [Genlisea aurea]
MEALGRKSDSREIRVNGGLGLINRSSRPLTVASTTLRDAGLTLEGDASVNFWG